MPGATVHRWTGKKPKDRELRQRIEALLPPDGDGFAHVTDFEGNDVRIELDWLEKHLGHHPKHRDRWQYIPIVQAALEHAWALAVGPRHANQRFHAASLEVPNWSSSGGPLCFRTNTHWG